LSAVVTYTAKLRKTAMAKLACKNGSLTEAHQFAQGSGLGGKVLAGVGEGGREGHGSMILWLEEGGKVAVAGCHPDDGAVIEGQESPALALRLNLVFYVHYNEFPSTL
jgi:hypothetical protein